MICDMHVHTRHIGMCTLPILNQFCKESYNDPKAAYDTFLVTYSLEPFLAPVLALPFSTYSTSPHFPACIPSHVSFRLRAAPLEHT
jgi:hypothetical protein